VSVWKRIRSLFGADPEPAASDEEAEGARRAGAPAPADVPGPAPSLPAADARDDPGTPPGRPDPLDIAAERLLALARNVGISAAEERAAIDAFERLREGGREVLAIDLARRVLAAGEANTLRCRVAERLDARGDEEGAREMLDPLIRLEGAPLDGWMLAAEIAERRGQVRDALAIYERIVARDVTYPRARERAARLRERVGAARRDHGATLMAEGAMARGRYRLLRELGRGGAGTVFLAEDGELDRRVALKVYHRRGRADRERLLHEARTAARLEHPGVIRVLDVDETLGAIAMESIEGGSVRGELGKGRVPLPRVLTWIEGVIDALRFVHGRGIVHRDLKPSNLLLRPGDRIVLTDFGTALRVGERAPGAQPQVEGTLAYMPPEQRAGAPAHPSMDVHALGAMIREFFAQTEGAPPPLAVEIAAACGRANPASRPTLAEIARAFEAVRAEVGGRAAGRRGG
jgi:serine/threonine-protein kinase